MARDLHDHWFREAKREGYRSRAVYKLREIDKKRQLLSRGDAVLDCGCAPGSWMQYASERVGESGIVAGIDLVEIAPLPESNLVTLVGDLNDVDNETLLNLANLSPGNAFDVVLSDMAPNTTGHRDTDHFRSIALCDLVLFRSGQLLREGGHLVMKMFEGESSRELVGRLKECFSEVRPMRPIASRSISREMFLVGTGRKPDTELQLPPPPSSGPPPVPESWSH